MKRYLLALLLVGCAGRVGPAREQSVCYTHDAGEFLSAAMTCDEATAPACGFTAVNEPVPVSPDYPVEFVCHCIGGVYACFGRQP